MDGSQFGSVIYQILERLLKMSVEENAVNPQNQQYKERAESALRLINDAKENAIIALQLASIRLQQVAAEPISQHTTEAAEAASQYTNEACQHAVKTEEAANASIKAYNAGNYEAVETNVRSILNASTATYNCAVSAERAAKCAKQDAATRDADSM